MRCSCTRAKKLKKLIMPYKKSPLESGYKNSLMGRPCTTSKLLTERRLSSAICSSDGSCDKSKVGISFNVCVSPTRYNSLPVLEITASMIKSGLATKASLSKGAGSFSAVSVSVKVCAKDKRHVKSSICWVMDEATISAKLTWVSKILFFKCTW